MVVPPKRVGLGVRDAAPLRAPLSVSCGGYAFPPTRCSLPLLASRWDCSAPAAVSACPRPIVALASMKCGILSPAPWWWPARMGSRRAQSFTLCLHLRAGKIRHPTYPDMATRQMWHGFTLELSRTWAGILGVTRVGSRAAGNVRLADGMGMTWARRLGDGVGDAAAHCVGNREGE